jgi:ABC-type antimicrobial peptide transport system permease subunit
MLKFILAIIVSYVVGNLVFFGLITGCFFLLGVERVFQPDSYEVSRTWLALTLIVSFLGAVIGGYLCLSISRSWGTCQVLALIVLMLTSISCILEFRRINPDAPNIRAGDVEYFDAMKLGVPPRWFPFVNPIVTCMGVLVGARIKGRSPG